jgi:hypothetical protein
VPRRAFGLACCLAVLATTGTASAAPYEPNDSIPSAAGPLLAGGTYSAALETPGDRDFFYFYVTAAAGARIELGIKNVGGGPDGSDLDVTVMDGVATPIQSVSYIRHGEERTLSVQLAPQKYFVEVHAGEGFGDGYSLSAGGGKGAFGSYEQIAKNCEGASADAKRSERRLKRAQERLLRTTALLRRSRYAPPTARRAARDAVHEARALVKARRKALVRAEAARSPWCSIPA